MSLGRLTLRELTLDPNCPTHVCAARDHGAGVRFGSDTFAIYSLAPLSTSCRVTLDHDAATLSELTTAALQVCETLPVHVNLDQESLAHLFSLPVPPSGSSNNNAIPHPPWFLIRAAKFEKHCVVGRNSAVEALLVVLQRPWCVLEICCCDTRTITAALSFAMLAARIDGAAYDAAVRLLSHEQKSRTPEPTTRWPSSAALCYTPSRTNISAALRDIYTATSINGIRSNNPFWLSLICSCAVYLNVAFSVILQHLQDGDHELPHTSSQRTGSHLISLYTQLLRNIGEAAV